MGIWQSFKNTVGNVVHTIGKAFSDTKNDISGDAHAVASTIGKAVTTVYGDVKGAGKAIYQNGQSIANKVVDDVKGTVDNTVNRTTNILSIPLILLGVGVIFFAYNSRSNFQASYNK
jgi:phage-related protein